MQGVERWGGDGEPATTVTTTRTTAATNRIAAATATPTATTTTAAAGGRARGWRRSWRARWAERGREAMEADSCAVPPSKSWEFIGTRSTSSRLWEAPSGGVVSE